MWELRSAHSQWRNPLRNLLIFVTALIVTTFGYLFISAPTVSAQATWSGSSIEYQSKEFTRNTDERANDAMNLPASAEIYQYRQTGSTEIEFIYFPDGGAATATNARYVTYTVDRLGNLSNKSTIQTINIDARAATEEEAAAIEETTSCIVDGIGWIVCPVTNFLATGMDWLFTALSDMLEVRRVELGGESPLYRAWKMMLSIANLAFIGAFLVIIYSQITSVGIQNYSIKRLLPRLIIAAVLVNVSYYICALAIDVSNIAGYSLQDIFINMRNSLVGESGNGWQIVSWSDIASFILAGGTAAAAGGVALFLTLSGTTVAGSIILLLPALLGVLLAVLVALLILAARQAIITVLVIIAPLAFVAYLLPNTEKWFDKWKDLFMTMLLMFPIFSLLFGGAQLAGLAIIQNADSINVIILGMVTQVAPIVITPLLIRFSGSLLGRIAGMVNNPNKGLLDRTRNWSKSEAERRKAQRTADVMTNPPKRRQLMRRAARGMELRNRRREQDMALWKKEAERGFEKARLTNRRIQQLDVELRLSSLETENFKQDSQRRFDELRAGKNRMLNIQPEVFATAALNRAVRADQEGRVITNQIREAQTMQQINYADVISRDDELRRAAGGIRGPEGADRALASAVKTIRSDYNESVSDAREVMKHYSLSGQQVFDHAMGGAVTGRDAHNNVRTFDHKNTYMREATIEEIFKIGTVEQIGKVIELSGVPDSGTVHGLQDYSKSVSEALASSSMPGKTVYLGGKIIDDVKSGNIDSPAALDTSILEYIAKGKFSAQKLATIDAQAVDRILTAINRGDRSMLDPKSAAALPDALTKLQANAYQALNHSDLKNEVTDASQPLLERLTAGYTPPPSPPTSTT